jgi:tRNA (guanine37-N1)-methyltransferase
LPEEKTGRSRLKPWPQNDIMIVERRFKMENTKLTFDIITLFPEMFSGPFSESILKRAQEKGTIVINLHNLRDYAEDKHKTVDDTPYGGGKGMVIKVDVVDRALSALKVKSTERIILLDPRGEKFDQDKAIELAYNYDRLIFVCGHYEGFDQRVVDNLVDESISIGDFVLTGGEIPTMAIVDATARMVEGVLSTGSAENETFMRKDEQGDYIKEYAQYTKPAEYNGWKVPETLMSGHHENIKKWRESRH